MRWLDRSEVTLLPRPAVAVTGFVAIAVQHTGNDVVSSDQRQRANGLDDVGGGAGPLSAPPTRQAVLSVGAPDPEQRQHDLRAPSSISATASWMRVRTIRFFLGQHIEGDRRQDGRRSGGVMLGDSRLVGGHPGEGAVPARRRQSGSPDRPHRTAGRRDRRHSGPPRGREP